MPAKSATMPVPPDFSKLPATAVPWAAELAWVAQQADGSAGALATLDVVKRALGGDEAALLAASSGRWQSRAQTGTKHKVPPELPSEAADRETVIQAGPWLAAPLRLTTGVEILTVHLATAAPKQVRDTLEALAPLIAAALDAQERRSSERRRTERAEAILEIARQWNKTHEMETLLNNIAQAATKLLAAQRASIFLWDRESKTLVGRPALGVDQELRVPDDAGVVGRVMQTGTPRRLSAQEAASEVNRNVDERLKFQTSNVLAVPLHSSSGELVGVFEVLNKSPGDFTDEDETALAELAIHAGIALENTQERADLVKARSLLREQSAEKIKIIGHSPAIEALRSTVRRVANTELAVLLLGENGAGKEVVSQSIHYLSRRKEEPFIAVNCGAIAETLLESELFGHEKGAFTDAHEARAGKFELASGGTLFLDEIGDMSLSGQAKLLRVLEEKVVVRVGGSKPIRTDARVIAATNRNLIEMVRAKKFREDLYFRLNVVTIQLPPLRDRGEDILLLADHFLQEFCKRAHRNVPKMTAQAKERLLAHPWPGNIRELRNLMERIAYLSSSDTVEAEEFAFILSPTAETVTTTTFTGTLAEATDQFQVDFIQQAIKRSRGNMSEAAERLGLHRSNLYRKMRQLGMQTGDE